MIFGRVDEELDHCLACGKKISNFEWGMNNGVCNRCPKLTQIAPQFWKVIIHMAAKGDPQAQETMRKYAHLDEGRRGQAVSDEESSARHAEVA